jgi:hypothetical protein
MTSDAVFSLFSDPQRDNVQLDNVQLGNVQLDIVAGKKSQVTRRAESTNKHLEDSLGPRLEALSARGHRGRRDRFCHSSNLGVKLVTTTDASDSRLYYEIKSEKRHYCRM